MIIKFKIAAFDMDGTIILTKSGKVYPVDDNDWCIGFDTCFKKLKQLNADNYKLVIFTNQRGLMKEASTDNFRRKIQNIQQKLNVPFQVRVKIFYMKEIFIKIFRPLLPFIQVVIENHVLDHGYS